MLIGQRKFERGPGYVLYLDALIEEDLIRQLRTSSHSFVQRRAQHSRTGTCVTQPKRFYSECHGQSGNLQQKCTHVRLPAYENHHVDTNHWSCFDSIGVKAAFYQKHLLLYESFRTLKTVHFMPATGGITHIAGHSTQFYPIAHFRLVR